MASTPRHLRIGHLSTVYHTAFILRGSDLLEKQDIAADWKLFPSGPDIIAAMQGGTIDLAYIGLPPVIIGIGRGLSLACIAGGHIEGTVMIAGQETRTLAECGGMREFLAQFAGKPVGTPPGGSIHDVIVRELLRRYGMEDISVKNYPWADFLPDALERGEIGAAAGTPALAVAARRYGTAKIVVPPDRLWPFNPSYGIAVMRNMLPEKDLLRGFLSAHESASELIRDHPRRCACIVAETTGMVDPDFVLSAYRISPKYCAALPAEYIASTMKFVSALHALGYIPRLVGEQEIFDRTLIGSVHPQKDHYRDGIATGE